MNAFMNMFTYLKEAAIFGKRAAKKDLLRTRILVAAREVFLSQSFESTTMGQIAAHAGIGLGTAYNYFGSKEELFLLAMAEEIEARVMEDTEKPSDGKPPADEIVSLVISNLKRLNIFGKRIWRVAMAAIFSGMKSSRFVVKTLGEADRRVMERIGARLEESKAQGELAADFPVSTAADLIYGSIMLHVAMYIYMDNVTAEEAFAKIESDIRFILGR
jgi:AcrR family transcriptional regulator